jgi:hypothetical protein
MAMRKPDSAGAPLCIAATSSGSNHVSDMIDTNAQGDVNADPQLDDQVNFIRFH